MISIFRSQFSSSNKLFFFSNLSILSINSKYFSCNTSIPLISLLSKFSSLSVSLNLSSTYHNFLSLSSRRMVAWHFSGNLATFTSICSDSSYFSSSFALSLAPISKNFSSYSILYTLSVNSFHTYIILSSEFDTFAFRLTTPLSAANIP